jgi:hypothetical protein
MPLTPTYCITEITAVECSVSDSSSQTDMTRLNKESASIYTDRYSKVNARWFSQIVQLILTRFLLEKFQPGRNTPIVVV